MSSKADEFTAWTKTKKIISDVTSWWAIVIFILVVGLFFFWLLWLNHVSINQVGIAYDSWDGKVTVQDQPGWYKTNPFTFVAKISTLPIKVKIPSDAAVINMKVVKFKKEGVEDYIRLQGFHWIVSDSELENILLGYAYSGQKWSFLEVVQEGGPENFTNPNKDWQRVSGEERPKPAAKGQKTDGK